MYRLKLWRKLLNKINVWRFFRRHNKLNLLYFIRFIRSRDKEKRSLSLTLPRIEIQVLGESSIRVSYRVREQVEFIDVCGVGIGCVCS
jgi:hypothetical protein